MNRQTLKAISGDIADALREVGERHGVSITTGRGTYSASNATLKLEIADIGEDGEVQTPEREAFPLYCEWNGISADALGATFKDHRGGTYTITGWRTKARKRPVETRGSDGKTYVWDAHTVRRLLPESLRHERASRLMEVEGL